MTHTDPVVLPDVDDLKARTRGGLLQPGDAGFHERTGGFNGAVRREPGAILGCAGVADVVAGVRYAAGNGVPLAVRSAGHDYAGRWACQGGLLLDLSGMDAVHVDPLARTVRVQPGARWGALDHETQAFGLATTGATVSTVGVAGFALGGGTGYLSRLHGLGADNLTALDVVTADGELVHANEVEHRDLFWALRGGSGNFGVVTSLEFRLHPLAHEVMAGQVLYRHEDAGDVLRFYRAFMAEAPDHVQCFAFFLKLPAVDAFPSELHGRTVLDLVVASAAPPDEGARALEPLMTFGDPFFRAVVPQPYTQVQRAFDAGLPPGQRWCSRGHYLDELSDQVIDRLLARTEAMPGDFSVAYFDPAGGAVGRVPPDATAFPHREARFGFHALAGWSDPTDDEACQAWARAVHEDLAPLATGGVYVNLLGHDQGPDGVQAAFGTNLSRLAQVKGLYDPDNLFRHTHNVPPAE